MATLGDFPGLLKSTNCDRTPPYLHTKFTNRETLEKISPIRTALGSSRWASQLERRQCHVSVASLTFLNRPSLAAFATLPSTRLLFLPPPPRPWIQRSLGCCAVFTKRSSFCYLFLLRNEPALHVLLFRFLNTSEPLTRFLRCQRAVFRFGGQV